MAQFVLHCGPGVVGVNSRAQRGTEKSDIVGLLSIVECREDNAVGECAGQPPPYLGGDPALANPTRPDDRDKPRVLAGEKPGQRGEVGLTADGLVEQEGHGRARRRGSAAAGSGSLPLTRRRRRSRSEAEGSTPRSSWRRSRTAE